MTWKVKGARRKLYHFIKYKQIKFDMKLQWCFFSLSMSHNRASLSVDYHYFFFNLLYVLTLFCHFWTLIFRQEHFVKTSNSLAQFYNLDLVVWFCLGSFRPSMCMRGSPRLPFPAFSNHREKHQVKRAAQNLFYPGRATSCPL